MSLLIRIAKASMSREISLVNDYDGIAKIELRVEFPRLRRRWFPDDSIPKMSIYLSTRPLPWEEAGVS